VRVRAVPVDETAADREYAGCSRSGSSLTAVRSISIEPLKYAPSSIMMRRSGQVPNHRTILLDFDAVAATQISLTLP